MIKQYVTKTQSRNSLICTVQPKILHVIYFSLNFYCTEFQIELQFLQHTEYSTCVQFGFHRTVNNFNCLHWLLVLIF